MLFGEQGGGVSVAAFSRIYLIRELMPWDLRGANEIRLVH